MAQTSPPADTPDAYVTWHSPAGHHGLHGPYPHDIAQQLVKFTPGPGAVVVGSVGASTEYRIVEILLTYVVANQTNDRRIAALLAGDIVHSATTAQAAVAAALSHTLAPFDETTDVATLADALVDAGFTKRR